jgi:two-component system phosphate regulon sensor histidine kinase PhoR
VLEALSIALALIAVIALVRAAVRNRRLAARLASHVDAAERLADGPAAWRSSEDTADRELRTPDPETDVNRLARALERVAVRAARDVAAVESERRKLDEILDGVPEGLLVTTAERVPTYANQAFRELFDVDRSASTGELLALVRSPKVHDALGRATTGTVSPPVEFSVGAREVSVVARQLEGQSGILLMARDVTDTNRLSRMRRDFVTNLSHEIKTPLAIIRGAAETLQEAGAGDTVAAERFVRRIVEQIYRMEDLLKDLLTLARLESPEAGQHRQPVDLAVVAHRAIELLAPLAARAGVVLRAEIEAAPALAGDAKALERLALNLVMNGIQYNRAGGHVTLRLQSRGDAIALEVEDDGTGIPEADLPRIFERFYRVDKGRGRAEGGSGLGLAIVKHVAQAHGGTVEVQSEVDRGSLFRVLLPIAVAGRELEAGTGHRGRGENDATRQEASRAVAGSRGARSGPSGAGRIEN